MHTNAYTYTPSMHARTCVYTHTHNFRTLEVKTRGSGEYDASIGYIGKPCLNFKKKIRKKKRKRKL